MDPCERDHFPDPGTPPFAQGETFFFPVFCQINSHIALSGATFVVPLRASTSSLSLSRHFASFNASAMPDPDTQAHQTLKTISVTKILDSGQPLGTSKTTPSYCNTRFLKGTQENSSLSSAILAP